MVRAPMIALFRQFLDTRAARLFFIVLVIPFIWWGVAGFTQNASNPTAVATVGARTVEADELAAETQRQLAQIARMQGGRFEPTPEIRRGVATQVLERLILQAALADEGARLGLVAPDPAVRDAVWEIPAFKGPGGTFDRATFQARLRQNNLTEQRFLDLIRADLIQRQLIGSAQAGVAAPDVLLAQVFAFQRESRTLDLVRLPFSAAPEPPAPSADQIRRAYDDDPQRYAAPAMRHVKAVVLSPETVAKGIQVSDADVAAYYEAHRSDFSVPEKRSLQVVTAQDQAAAGRIAARWREGADWASVQKEAAGLSAATAAMEEATRADLPGAALAEAAFAAQPGAVVGPVRSDFGWQILRVTRVVPGEERSLAQAHEEIRARIARERATDQVYASAGKLDDELSSGADFDHIPDDLGAVLVGGNMDEHGNTASGEPAPIPGTPALRQALVTAAFAARLNDPPRLIEGPDQSYFALQVDAETPAQPRPFEQVQDQVRADWIADQRRRVQEVVAGRLLAAARAGDLAEAAAAAGVRIERTPPLSRSGPAAGIPPGLIEPAFALPPGGATMIETPDGFYVARLADVAAPAIGSDPVGAAQTRQALSGALAQDVSLVFAAALRDRARPTVNRALLDRVAQ